MENRLQLRAHLRHCQQDEHVPEVGRVPWGHRVDQVLDAGLGGTSFHR